ncbi:lyase family protein [Naasia lichenicola]|uniref:3-carboxy-cis,cis-muconate cycloisomerase n=1 Tax=Naasia lichenicola TaxID=2565933 RepID=A0A4S4FME1_9MICO|nr:lyase family protein [Naasia lichenicola]THG31670.1 3-carboxy-cis,cis-muconate cycloisomerase [Naasia lichenicola]
MSDDGAAGPVVDLGLLDPLTGPTTAAVVGDAAYLSAMIEVEAALIGAFVDIDVAPVEAEVDVAVLAAGVDLLSVAAAARGGGNPVIPLVAALRSAAPQASAPWLHRGATSQDILDSAAMLVASRALAAISADLRATVGTLADLADAHRHTPMAGRTLSQQAAPTTFGLRVASWLDAVVTARTSLRGVATRLPAQLAGAVGSATTLVDAAGGVEPADRLRIEFADRLGLEHRASGWHTDRTIVVELGSALALVIGSLGRIGLDVSLLSRTEIAEVSEGLAEGEGGSSAMPQKRNPVASVLLVAAARRSPGLLGTLAGSLLAEDDRPVGAWHAEWPTLRELLRIALGAAAAARGLVAGLSVDAERMRDNLALTDGAIHAERATEILTEQVGRARAAELVKAALDADGGFSEAILYLAEQDSQLSDTASVLAATTVHRGPVGLSNQMIDAAIVRAGAST